MTFSGGAGFWRAIGTARPDGLDRARRPRARSGRQLHRHRQRLFGRPVGDSARAGAARPRRQARGRHRRHQGARAAWGRGRTPSACRAATSSIRSPRSLKRLGLDHVDLYQIHGFDPVTPIEETLRALDDCVERGLVRTIGCSNLAAWQIMKALGDLRQAAGSPASRPCRPITRSRAASSSARSCRWSRTRGSASWCGARSPAASCPANSRARSAATTIRAARPSTSRRSTRSAPTTSSTRWRKSPRRTTRRSRASRSPGSCSARA